MKFRRKRSEPAPAEQAPAPAPEDRPAEDRPAEDRPAEETTAGAGTATGPRAHGPWDVSEVDLEDDQPERVDLGGLLVRPRQDLELRLQVDEASQRVVAVLLVGREGAVELRPFAAPRNGDIWTDIRKQIGAETARRGGTATEAEGPYGTELRVVMPAKTPDGKPATQPSRVLGIQGPRWLLRATLLGQAAVQPRADGPIETALRDVVVVRGTGAMAPGEPLPLTMPGGARPVPGQDV